MSIAAGKWFPDVEPGVPVHAAAETVLRVRAASVRGLLRKVDRGEAEQVEVVHQLRVSSRRLAAALAMFRSVISAEVYRAARRSTTRIRQGAGGVRDADVQVAGVTERLSRCSLLKGRMMDAILATLKRRRRRSRRALERDVAAQAAVFEGAMSDVLGQIRARAVDSPATRFGELAAREIGVEVDAVVSAGNGALTTPDQVHALRIALKRLRYGLEVFMGCLDRALVDRAYECVQRLQEELGTINDLRMQHSLLAGLREDALAGYRKSRRDAAALQYDHALARLAMEWLQTQERFSSRWATTEREGFLAMLTRLVDEAMRTSGAGNGRLIGLARADVMSVQRNPAQAIHEVRQS